jgi:hypothetical protein
MADMTNNVDLPSLIPRIHQESWALGDFLTQPRAPVSWKDFEEHEAWVPQLFEPVRPLFLRIWEKWPVMMTDSWFQI